MSPPPLKVIDRDGKVVSDHRGHCMPTSDKRVKAKEKEKSLSIEFFSGSVSHRKKDLN